MLNFQVSLSQLQCRKNEFNIRSDQFIVFRFGSIKLDIKMIQKQSLYFGGKRIVLDLSQQQLHQMFKTYAIGLFIENQHDNFFSILSMQKIKIQQPIDMHEIYFYNNQQQIIYDAKFSFNIKSLRNPRLPNNKEKIQNHKTFQQFFTKPPIPQKNTNQTISSFLYGNGTLKNQKNIKKVSQNINKKTNDQISTKKSKTFLQNYNKKPHNYPMNSLINTGYQHYSNNNLFPHDQDQQENRNPPVMQFTNKQEQNPRQKALLLQTRLQQLNERAPEYIKFQTAINRTNAFSKDKANTNKKINQFSLTTKITQKLESQKQIHNKISNTSKLGEFFSQNNIKFDREQLRNKAKQQLSEYQSINSIKIPFLKDGKYQYIDISNLNDQEIKIFAFQQKAIQQDSKQKQMIQKKLKEKEKENQKLKKQLENKQKMMIKQQEEANKKQYELLIQAKNNNQQKKQQKKQMSNKSYQSSNNNYEDSNDKKQSQDDQENEQKYSNQEQQYQQDFQSQSQAISQLKSKLSMQSSQNKKDDQSYSYDSNDFQSFSQSLLDSQKRLSHEQINDNGPSYKEILKKKYGY